MNEQSNIPDFGAAGNGKPSLAEDKLLAYLEGSLTPHEQREVELWLAEEGMESDAIEGLKMMPAADTRQSVGRINHKLRKTLTGAKRKRRPANTQEATYIAIVLLLFLAAVAYYVVSKTSQKPPAPPAMHKEHSVN